MLCKEKIQKWLEARGWSIPEEANCGDCENFAQDFQSDIPGAELYGAEEFDGPDTEWAGHIWLYDGKLHYDSESPEGVADWKDLKFYRRMARRKIWEAWRTDVKFSETHLEWEALAKSIAEQPMISRTVTARMPRDCDGTSSIMRSTCDGIYPIRQGIHMKKSNPTIVAVTSRKIDRREPEARELIAFLKTLPVDQVRMNLVYQVLVGNMDKHPCVERLTSLALSEFDVKVGNDFNFMRVSVYPTEKKFFCTYMEYVGQTDDDVAHYEPFMTEKFEHVVDAFVAFKKRFTSGNPYRASSQ
jgi:hypothetical protein